MTKKISEISGEIGVMLEKNALHSRGVSSMMAKDYAPLKFNAAARKACVEKNKEFFHRVVKPAIMGR